jgi:carbon monoxide dehydrogenase subunit G
LKYVIDLPEEFTDLPEMPELSPGDWSTLNKGKFVKKHERYTDGQGFSCGTGIAYMTLDRPPLAVWKVILGFDSYRGIFPSVSKTETYKVDGDEIFVEFKLKFGPLLGVRYHTHHTFFPNQSRLIWKMDESRKNDFKQAKGMWTAWPLEGGRSLIGYTVELESGRSLPKFAEEKISQVGLNKVMEALKKNVR